MLLALAACGPEPPAARQLVVLAVDGLDPDILSRLIASARLPHLAALAAKSGVVRVVSTPGAESASAWASFATGLNPGGHGIFDAIAPDPITARPRAAALRPRDSAQWIRGVWKEGPAYAAVRDGTPFWTELGRAGIRARVLFVPGTFPPEPIEAGSIVSGLPLPDLGGVWGSGYTWLASDIAPGDVGFTRYGGRVERLGLSGRVHFAGARRDLGNVLNAIDMFVMPSLWEGLPLSLVLAMGAGLPVIASKVAGIPEVVGDDVSGLLVDPGDANGRIARP